MNSQGGAMTLYAWDLSSAEIAKRRALKIGAVVKIEYGNKFIQEQVWVEITDCLKGELRGVLIYQPKAVPVGPIVAFRPENILAIDSDGGEWCENETSDEWALRIIRSDLIRKRA